MEKTILIVDDNANVRKALRLCFESEDGLQVCGEAVDGRDAIEKAKQFKPDLIILDFSMPLMNGIDAAIVLTRLMPAVPLVLLTMHAETVLELRARSAGVSVVVSKAQSLEVLVEQVHILLKHQNPRGLNEDI